MLREYQYRWTFDLKSSPEDLWPFVADTNRFNRDTGVPAIQVDEARKPLRKARRKVGLSIHGMDLEWEEQPFEWVRPLRFGIERVYSKGPMARMRALAELTPNPEGGTQVTYEVRAQPRNAIGTIAIPLQIKLISGPKFRAAFHKYDELASQGITPSLSDATTALPDFDQPGLNALGERLIKESLQLESSDARAAVERLIDFLRTGDDFSVARIRPFSENRL